MAGIRMKLKSVAAQIYDTFETAGNVEGAPTAYGGKTWAKVGAGDTTVVKLSGKAKASGGSTNTILTLPTGSHNFDIGFTVASTAHPTSITAAVVRALSTANLYSVSLRTAADKAEYALLKRENNVNTTLVATGVVPMPGDKVFLSIRNHVATLKVNGVRLGQATLETLGSTFNAGLLFNGQDTASAIEDFAVYPG